MSKKKPKVSGKDFIKNLLVSWYLFLFAGAICGICSYAIVLWVTDLIQERTMIAQSVSEYVIVEGTVESVKEHKYYDETKAGGPPDFIPDMKYSAVISYMDEDGTQQQLNSSQVDKKLKEDMRVTIAYNPETQDGDIAYFDIWVWTHVPYELNTFKISNIFVVVMLLSQVILFGSLICGLVKECAEKEYKKKEKKAEK